MDVLCSNVVGSHTHVTSAVAEPERRGSDEILPSNIITTTSANRDTQPS